MHAPGDYNGDMERFRGWFEWITSSPQPASAGQPYGESLSNTEPGVGSCGGVDSGVTQGLGEAPSKAEPGFPLPPGASSYGQQHSGVAQGLESPSKAGPVLPSLYPHLELAAVEWILVSTQVSHKA